MSQGGVKRHKHSSDRQLNPIIKIKYFKKSKNEKNNWFWDEEILEEDEENIIYEINYPIASEKNEKKFKILENFLEVYDRIVTRSWKLKLDTDEILEILSLEEQGMSDGEAFGRQTHSDNKVEITIIL